jgi:hypothetical protein
MPSVMGVIMELGKAGLGGPGDPGAMAASDGVKAEVLAFPE